MTLGRLAIAADGRRLLSVNLRLLASLYAFLGIGILGTQLAGSVLPASGGPSAIGLGKELVLGGLLARVVALVAWFVQRRIQQIATSAMASNDNNCVRWKNHFRAIQLVTLLIIIRSIVGTVEYVQGPDGFVISYEIFIYVFDAALMWLVMAIYTILHSGRLVRDAQWQKTMISAKD
ncbi:hypothetical protein RRF57_003148 [Xylaria bambusicola]|uniref:Uncharacterized protein n=1 Tax=Xylaria bambusicola TaxID=326684 RepID=A0AAN7UEN0_9PEZI